MKNSSSSVWFNICSVWKCAATLLLGFILCTQGSAQVANRLASNTRNQIAELLREKATRTPTQQKINTQLLYAAKERRFGFINRRVPTLRASLKTQLSEGGRRVKVDIDATVTDDLIASIKAAGGEILENFPDYHAIRAIIPLDQVELLAGRSEIKFIRPAVGATTNTGTVNAEGDVAHGSNLARLYGASGYGIKVAVLSDSLDDGHSALAHSRATGNIGPVTILPGQAGSGEAEGLAMLEIVHDLAPSATLYFATGFGGPASFAQNIRNLAAAGCKVIIDDVTNFSESPFQDGPIAQAVNDVSAQGVLFFSSARNSGNKDDGTSGTWEGDFVDGGDASFYDGLGSRYHAFSATDLTDTVTMTDQPRADLFWADPLGASTNDYDLFVLDNAGNVLRSSVDTQNGTQDPYESVDTLNVNERILIVKYSGAGRFIHLDTGRCQLSISTAGCVRGHNASGAANAFSVAETNADNRTTLFTGGAANPVNTQSSDGPRRIFFNPNGSAITPGNFSSTGGRVLQKPDITAATGVKTSLPTTSGLNPFFGTSAAAPHAGAIAAQILSYRPGLTPAQVRVALNHSALNIEAPGFDRDSGFGIIMTLPALNYASTKGDFNFNGRSEIIWQHTSGARSLWFLNGYTYGSAVSLGVISPAWNIMGLADFDRNGNSDILWQNTAGGRYIWLMQGTRILRSVHIGNLSTAWNFAGAGDFNGDGKPDILLEHSSGARGVWLMNGILFSASRSLPSAAPSWKFMASGDFNRDGKTDIVLQNTSGAVQIWLMNGTTLLRTINLGTVATTWKVAGSGDFNGDGKPDILFQSTTGARQIWIMNGTVRAATVNLQAVSPTWTIRNF
jgi:Subtilase family/FG-GAP-like repeat